MSRPTIALIFNPAARGDKAARFRAWLGQLHGDVALLETFAPGSATGLARQAVKDGFRTVVASGGDGTINEVVNGLGQAPRALGPVRLGILPLGTMNVFARELGIPLATKQAWDTVRLGHARAVDLPLARLQTESGEEERAFIQMIGAGLDGDAVGGVSIPLKRRVGASAYLASTLSALRAKPPRLTAKWPGGSAEGEWMCVGNGTMYGGPFTLFPDAKVNDGMLDLCVLPRVNSGVIIRAVTAMLLGRLDHWPGVTYHRVREVKIDGPAGIRVQADGDFVGTLPIQLSVLPRRLNV
ncbi:MAG: diacylglycerol kinase family protein, partial [Verrucomicrobiota bacterium]|nr:diacylglycerol kinase family protein [Verrucomicrobiota bacterium]